MIIAPAIEKQDPWTTITRAIIPYFATVADARVTSAFQRTCEQVLTERHYLAPQELTNLLSKADQHIESMVKRNVTISPPADIAKLERYMLAVRLKWGIFAPKQSRQELENLVMAHNISLYDKWVGKHHFSKKAFFRTPDLVDFVFKAHLHRYINYPAYGGALKGHAITWGEGDARLLMNGVPQQWSKLRHHLFVDNVSERIYSTEGHAKQYWYYLQSGLIKHNQANYNPPVPLKTLPPEHIPNTCQVQVVTTHDPRDKWGPIDDYLQGARHSFYRVVLRNGFDLNPQAQHFRPGEVYSFGFRPYWDDFNPFAPLESYKGYMQCPDKDEFLPVDFHVTTLNVCDKKALDLLRITQDLTNRNLSFNFVTTNCAGVASQALQEANIVNIKTGSHMLTIWYELLLPKPVRYGLDSISAFSSKYTPDFLQKGTAAAGKFAYSIIFTPIFTLLGAWRTKITPEARAHQQPTEKKIQALFSNVWDIFNPENMTYNMTKNIYKWQKEQGSKTQHFKGHL